MKEKIILNLISCLFSNNIPPNISYYCIIIIIKLLLQYINIILLIIKYKKHFVIIKYKIIFLLENAIMDY